MSESYTVRVLPQAKQHIFNILAYIAKTLNNPIAAKNLSDRLEREIASLGNFPEKVRLIDEEPWRNQGVRKVLVQNFYVYYVNVDEAHRVDVFAVIYARADQEKALSEL